MAARDAPKVRVPATIGRRWTADMVVVKSSCDRARERKGNY
jgi:hypothetical protein